jgi:DNA-directed RNA polymerase subunit RPC12/RpoP
MSKEDNMKVCPECGHPLSWEIRTRTASRQQCPECKKWFIVDEEDQIMELGDYACKRCGYNIESCTCTMDNTIEGGE